MGDDTKQFEGKIMAIQDIPEPIDISNIKGKMVVTANEIVITNDNETLNVMETINEMRAEIQRLTGTESVSQKEAPEDSYDRAMDGI